MKNLSADLEDIIKTLGLYEEFKLEFMRKDFESLFPSPLCEHLYPSSFRNGRLVILVDAQEWLNEIRLHKEEMERRLSRYGVESVRFKLGRVFRRKQGKPPAATSSKKTPVANIPEDLIEDIAAKIEDPSLRKSLLDAISSTWLRKKR